MKLQDLLLQRSENKCELCKSKNSLQVYEVLPQTGSYEDSSIVICNTCLTQIEKKAELDNSHWNNYLPESMWSEVPGVQVVS